LIRPVFATIGKSKRRPLGSSRSSRPIAPHRKQTSKLWLLHTIEPYAAVKLGVISFRGIATKVAFGGRWHWRSMCYDTMFGSLV
jgi:hypothetical protein